MVPDRRRSMSTFRLDRAGDRFVEELLELLGDTDPVA
jgi:hypothetical protein